MFGLRIVSEKQLAKLVSDIAEDAIRSCELVAKARGGECGTELGRGRNAAAADIRELLKAE